MRLLGVYLGDIYLLHVAIFEHLPKRPLEAKISSSSEKFFFWNCGNIKDYWCLFYFIFYTVTNNSLTCIWLQQSHPSRLHINITHISYVFNFVSLMFQHTNSTFLVDWKLSKISFESQPFLTQLKIEEGSLEYLNLTKWQFDMNKWVQ